MRDLERKGRFAITDGYNPKLGRMPFEVSWNMYSLQVPNEQLDKAFDPSRFHTFETPPEQFLRIVDSVSPLYRGNDEKTWVEFVLNRMIPYAHLTNSTLIAGVTRGIHPDSTYKLLEAEADGVIEVRLRKTEEDDRGSFIGIKSMRDVLFDSRWHRLRVGDKFKVTLEK